MIKGIDISKWQGDFDLAEAKAEGQEFVIIKAGGGNDGLYVDRFFETNYKKAKALGMPVGCYFFSLAKSEAEAVKEAEYFYENCLKDKQFDLPVYIDVEGEMLKIEKSKLTAIIKTWCEALEKKGYFVGIYASLSAFENRMNDEELAIYTHWVAHWSNECGYKNKNILGVWQFGGETNPIRSNKVAGVVCDQDYMLIDYSDIIKNKGFNGYAKAAPAPAKKSVDTLAKEVIDGKWGNGSERKKRLTDAGYNYKAVQARVNYLLETRLEKIALEVIRGEWGNGFERKKKLKAAGYDYNEVQKLVDAYYDK